MATWLSVCLSVCVSVALIYCAQTTESLVARPSRHCSPAILVFPYQIAQRDPPSEGVKWERGRQKSQNPANPASGGLSAIAEILVSVIENLVTWVSFLRFVGGVFSSITPPMCRLRSWFHSDRGRLAFSEEM